MTFRRNLFSLIALLAVLALGLGRPSFSASAAGFCDAAQFVTDVTIPDGTRLTAGTAFTKTWRIKNAGTCTWTTSYSLVFVNGEKMGGPDALALPQTVAPGQTVDLTVNLVAPSAAGTYFGYWQLRNSSGTQFGIGTSADKSFWVEIIVPAPLIEGYDFTAEVCGATWSYDGGPIPCPFKVAKQDFGYVKRLENPQLENGQFAGQPGLLTVPQNKLNGVIRGVYPIIDIFPGDRFQAVVGCQAGAVSCYVTFELDYLTGSNELVTIWKFKEKYDGLVYPVDLDIGKYSFRNKIRLVLIVSASGPATGDFAIWVAPRIARQFSGGPVITPTATSIVPTAQVPTSTPVSTAGCDIAAFITDVTIPDNTVLAPGTSFTKTWRFQNAGTCTWTTAYSLVFLSGERMGALIDPIPLPQAVVPGQTADVSVNLVAPLVPGTYRGYWAFKNATGGLFGIGPTGDKPFWVQIVVSGPTPTPPSTATPAPSATPLPSPTPTATTIPGWLTLTNQKYGFKFNYPPQSLISNLTDNGAHIALPFVSGTNLVEKYMDLSVQENLNPCVSPMGPGFITPQQVIINGITFTKEGAADAGVGHVHKWVAYSTLKGNACISMGFVLHWLQAGNFATPPPLFDEAAESAVFDQIMSTFGWLTP
jgi:hypothetical protein